MSKSYEKICDFCGKKIQLSDELGKWRPFNLDGTEHECKKKNGNGKDRKEITLEMVLQKLESHGIIINVERLMKE
jgi:hypothetical protein